jgi:acetyl-CoA carboxylase biotin carboxyl carrier protein
MGTEKKSSWLERVEDLIHVLEGSSIGELELTENGTEIVIRRKPGMVLTAAPSAVAYLDGLAMLPAAGRGKKSELQGVAIVAPLTGVYYSAASPSTPAFANVGDAVNVGQVVALVEAMKVFNEITSEISGRVVAMVAKNGEVVQKGDVLLRVEPA